mmetsp:Transcript_3828/g.12367  ORF Transcript_3828/g.12367 Transcript_3828/m.12367 type:complete len:219 (+) Transcript_3828:425-1081(+)
MQHSDTMMTRQQHPTATAPPMIPASMPEERPSLASSTRKPLPNGGCPPPAHLVPPVASEWSTSTGPSVMHRPRASTAYSVPHLMHSSDMQGDTRRHPRKTPPSVRHSELTAKTSASDARSSYWMVLWVTKSVDDESTLTCTSPRADVTPSGIARYTAYTLPGSSTGPPFSSSSVSADTRRDKTPMNVASALSQVSATGEPGSWMMSTAPTCQRRRTVE